MITISHKTPFLQALSEINNKNEIKCLNFLLYLKRKYKRVIVSHQRLADHIGLKNRETACRLVKRLAKKGLLSTKRNYDAASEYFLNSGFFIFAEKVVYLFSSLKKFVKHRFLLRLKSKVTSIYKVVLNTKYLYNTPVYNNNLHEKERAMELKITDALRKVTNRLNLTKWGQIKLCSFPDDVLLKALECYEKYGSNIKDPFNYLFMYCKEYCAGADIEIDWNQYYQLKEHYKMPDNSIFIAQAKPPVYQTNYSPRNLSSYSKQASKERSQRWAQLEPEAQERLNNTQQYFLNMLRSNKKLASGETNDV